MQRKQRPKRRKWKYADFAKKRRHCERCMKRLKKEEVKICHGCYIELLRGITDEVHK